LPAHSHLRVPFAAAALVVALAVTAGALAQTRASAQARARLPTFGARSALVVLSATAVDRNGRPVQDLAAHEFRVFEEGRPQPLTRFSTARDLTARVLLLIDASGSMGAEESSTSVRMAAVQLLAALGRDDEAALSGFDSEYWGVVPFTRERETLLQGLDRIRPFGSTALHDALDRAAEELAAQGEGRRAVVVLTDGVDTASRRTPDEVVARSKALDVPIYTVSVVSRLDDPRSPLFTGRERPSAALAGQAQLARYAQLSGGGAVVVSEFAALRAAAQRIASELKHQYRLGYDPPDGPARFRRVEVRSTRKGVAVRTRSGYVPLS
jgi:Ca-activated chloride channel family protein